MKPLGRAGRPTTSPSGTCWSASSARTRSPARRKARHAALIGGFMELIGQQEIWENIKKGNAVVRAWPWFQGAMKGALALVASIPGRVMSTLRSLTIFDIVTLVGAFAKVVGAFASFVGDFIRWAGSTVLNLLEIIFSVVAPSVVPYLKKARQRVLDDHQGARSASSRTLVQRRQAGLPPVRPATSSPTCAPP